MPTQSCIKQSSSGKPARPPACRKHKNLLELKQNANGQSEASLARLLPRFLKRNLKTHGFPIPPNFNADSIANLFLAHDRRQAAALFADILIGKFGDDIALQNAGAVR